MSDKKQRKTEEVSFSKRLQTCVWLPWLQVLFSPFNSSCSPSVNISFSRSAEQQTIQKRIDCSFITLAPRGKLGG